MERSQRHHSEHRRAEYERLRKKTKQEEFVEALHREFELSPRFIAAAFRRRRLLVPLVFSGSSGPLGGCTKGKSHETLSFIIRIHLHVHDC